MHPRSYSGHSLNRGRASRGQVRRRQQPPWQIANPDSSEKATPTLILILILILTLTMTLVMTKTLIQILTLTLILTLILALILAVTLTLTRVECKLGLPALKHYNYKVLISLTMTQR